MTYARLLLVCVAPPTIGLALAVALVHTKSGGRAKSYPLWPQFATLLALIGIATLYTAPWDDHLIALGAWRYTPKLLGGVFLGRMPLEEVAFFPLQTLLVGLWWMWLTARSTRASMVEARRGMAGAGASGRLMAALAVVPLWLGALLLLLTGWRQGTYIGWEAAWSLPPLAFQMVVGGDILWRRRWLVGWVTLPAALYLSAVDTLALRRGIWTIDPHHSLGVLIGGQLPIEELFFFLVTTALIACGLVLGDSAETWQRASLVYTRWGSRIHDRVP